MRVFVDLKLGNMFLTEFVKAYEDGKISSSEAYQMLKKVLDSVIGNIHGTDDETRAFALFKRIDKVRGDLTKKGSSTVSDKKKGR